MTTSMELARVTVFTYLHVVRNHTALALFEHQGTQNSGDGKLEEFEKEQNISLPFLWYSTYLSFNIYILCLLNLCRHVDHSVLSLK